MDIREHPILLLAIFVVVVGILIFVLYPKDCKVDKLCFNEKFSKCKPAKFTEIKDNNLYEYRVFGVKNKECVFESKLLRLEPGADVTVKALLENKAMNCKIPVNTIKKLEDVDNLVTYCTGPLKEAIYTLLVKRMYGGIIRNLNQIVEETRKVVK
jgi:hypothetical protein